MADLLGNYVSTLHLYSMVKSLRSNMSVNPILQSNTLISAPLDHYSAIIEESLLIVLASAYSRYKHAGQVRKYTGEEYWTHCAWVGGFVGLITGDAAMAAAAYLHDTVEDTDATVEEIRSIFGEDVAQMVDELTDKVPKSAGNREQRKALERQRLGSISKRSKTIKCADICSNLSSIGEHDPDFARVYFREKQADLPFLVDCSHPVIYFEAEKRILDYLDKNP